MHKPAAAESKNPMDEQVVDALWTLQHVLCGTLMYAMEKLQLVGTEYICTEIVSNKFFLIVTGLFHVFLIYIMFRFQI